MAARTSWPGARAALWLLCLALLAPPASTSVAAADDDALDALLDGTFRIDIETIDVTLDWYPPTGWVDGAARLTFRMRDGQTRAAFNFQPFVDARTAVTRLVLDGRELSPQSDLDVRILSLARTAQRFVELEYPLDPDVVHELVVEYRLTVPATYPRFSTEVNDLRGRGNEALWPTLNTPHELARHVVTLRVHDTRPFNFVGSGRSTYTVDGGVQQWVLDTQRAISSYSVLFVLLPAADTEYREWLIDDVPVRVVAYPTVNFAEARLRLDAWLPELRDRFGPFPALHGLSLFIFGDSGGGMEYYGGSITSLSALRHEVLHSYFGCSVVLRTYPDSWLDEAITSWFEETSRGVGHAPLPATYRGNWVGARSPASVGFSILAYTDGASIMQDVADRLGGTDRMTDFLRSLEARHAFAPFTTLDFAAYLKEYSGIDLRTQFLDWLYNGREPDALGGQLLPSSRTDRKTLNLDPPWIRRRGGT
jgi:hypothetical protein